MEKLDKSGMANFVDDFKLKTVFNKNKETQQYHPKKVQLQVLRFYKQKKQEMTEVLGTVDINLANYAEINKTF